MSHGGGQLCTLIQCSHSRNIESGHMYTKELTYNYVICLCTQKKEEKESRCFPAKISYTQESFNLQVPKHLFHCPFAPSIELTKSEEMMRCVAGASGDLQMILASAAMIRCHRLLPPEVHKVGSSSHASHCHHER